MANVKQILVVDDHFEMLEFLRSMLELSGQDYEVLAVPSAEEGLLELHRTKFDLLITDVRLPGMSGFDLVRRVRRVRADMSVIMITAYSTPQGKKEAEDLNIYRYYTKPLDTDAMLSAVYTALYGEEETAVSSVKAATISAPRPLSPQVQQRLSSLRADTGATGLFLADMNGQILYKSNHNSSDIKMDELVTVVTTNIKNSFNLAATLGDKVPFTIQYHAGNAYELYNANIGRHYYITMYFDVTSRRGRIGTIWIFAQRAIQDLSKLLPDVAGEVDSATLATEEDETPPARTTPAKALPPQPALPKKSPSRSRTKARPEPEPEKEKIDYDAERNLIDEVPSWSDLEPAEPVADLNGLLDMLNLGDEATAVDFDDFWDESLEDTGKGAMSGISFEEAMKRGLVSLGGDDAPAETE